MLARWRRVKWFYDSARADEFLTRCRERPERSSGDFTFKVNASPIPSYEENGQIDATGYAYILLDVEAAHTTLTPGGLRQLDEDAKRLLNGLTEDNPISEAEFEFIDLRLPDTIRGALDEDVVRSALREQFGSKDQFASLIVSQRPKRLSIGPEKSGAILAVARYIEAQKVAASSASYAVFDSNRYSRLLFVPLLMAVCLVLSWFLPLNWLAALGWFALYLALMGTVIFTLWRKIPLRHFFLRARTGSALFFFVIAAFATAYAIADLFDPQVLASDGSKNVGLGNAYLIATGITFTAGVLTAPLKGLGLQIAHVQMIVFMATVVNVVIAMLRLERPQGQRRA